jgi:hypothetical protein
MQNQMCEKKQMIGLIVLIALLALVGFAFMNRISRRMDLMEQEIQGYVTKIDFMNTGAMPHSKNADHVLDKWEKELSSEEISPETQEHVVEVDSPRSDDSLQSWQDFSSDYDGTSQRHKPVSTEQ